MNSITDLEAVAIGHILQFQPCTAHFIRTCFRESPSSRFSDSAGSVYPMMKRLEQRGLTQSQEEAEGNRMVRYYRVTRAGRRSLKEWIGPPVCADAALTVDPLRTRMIYLRHLTATQRQQWLDEAESILEAKLAEVSSAKYIRVSPDGSEYAEADLLFIEIANENAVLDLRARLKWIRSTRTKLAAAGMI